jgi:tRNA dimethylallyltransferase
MSEEKKSPLVVILGPTAVGKTSVSIALAQRFDAEIISADSRLLYRGMNIGTAKPTPQEMGDVPHHLMDVADPDEIWSLALYQKAAYRVIDAILARDRLPFLVGGTGQYIRSLIEGWCIPPQAPDHQLRDFLTAWASEIGKDVLHQKLALLDPEAAAIIDYRNVRRTVRALEVIFRTGERFTDLRHRQAPKYRNIILGIARPREVLYDRVDRRIEMMLDEGFVDEVESLLAAGYSPDLPTMSAIGYREITQYLAGDISLTEAVETMKRKTRIFVRRQTNWFKPDDERIRWFDAGPDLVDVMEKYIRRQLENESP